MNMQMCFPVMTRWPEGNNQNGKKKIGHIVIMKCDSDYSPAVSNAKGFLGIISANLTKPILPQKGVDINTE